MSQKPIKQLSDAAIAEIEGMNFVNILGPNLRVVSELNVANEYVSLFRLKLKVFYDNNLVGILRFSLHNYDQQECLELAQNISKNEYLLREIDDYLSGGEME